MDIYATINAIMKDLDIVGKTKDYEVNGVRRYSFRGIDAVVNALAPLMRTHGLITVPVVIDMHNEIVPTGSNQTSMIFTRLRVQYYFYALDGSSVTAVVAAESMDSADKSTVKAMSVAWRTALVQVFALATDEPELEADISHKTKTVSEMVRGLSTAADLDAWNSPKAPMGVLPNNQCIHGARRQWTAPDSGAVFWYCPLPKGDPEQCKVNRAD